MLEVADLARRYGDVVALDGLSFTVEPGQLFGFVGPNGAGKTTTMRIILGVLAADAGEVRWRGRPVDLATRARFGYMPEERGLYPKMRVRDQLAYFAELHGLARAEAGAAADTWLERLGIADRAGDRVETLSLGNQQRVQLAVALVHGPELLVLDEPFSGLDPVGVDVLSGVLRELADEGVPVVFSSHQLELVERLCESVVIINNGRLVASGRVEDLRERGAARPLVRVAVRGGRRGVARGRAGRRGRRPRRRRRARGAHRRGAAGGGARRGAGGRHGHALRARAADAERAVPQGGGVVSGLKGRAAVALVARREISTKLREKAFLISVAVTVAIIVLVAVVPPLLGAGGSTKYRLAAVGGGAVAVAEEAKRQAGAFDAEITVVPIAADEVDATLGDVDAVLTSSGLRAQEEPDDDLVNAVQAASRQARQAAALRDAGLEGAELRAALNPPPLSVSTVEAVDPDRDRKAAFAFVAILALYAQLLTFGYLLASGVVEEKASRVVEVLLSTIRPKDLLAGKVIGLGLLGFVQLVLMTAVGLAAATASGALEVDGDILGAAALAVGWFVLGYAFYACLFACAGAIVPRQEELQSTMTPLTMVILVSFFVSFIVLEDPDGTVARVTSFIPFSAPITMPPRIALGEASTFEILAAIAITAGATLALIPLAGRIYSGAVLRTGSAVKLREAWRALEGELLRAGIRLGKRPHVAPRGFGGGRQSGRLRSGSGGTLPQVRAAPARPPPQRRRPLPSRPLRPRPAAARPGSAARAPRSPSRRGCRRPSGSTSSRP